MNSVNQGQTLNANAATGRSKADNPEAASVFAALMNGNYSTINDLSVKADATEKATASDGFERYQYRDNRISPANTNEVADKISNSPEELESFEKDVVSKAAEELNVDEDMVTDALLELGMTAFDLLEPQNLALVAVTVTESDSPADLLINSDFQELMQDMGQMGAELMETLDLQPDQLKELVSQMDAVQEAIPLENPNQPITTDVEIPEETTAAEVQQTDAQPIMEETTVAEGQQMVPAKQETKSAEQPVADQQEDVQQTERTPKTEAAAPDRENETGEDTAKDNGAEQETLTNASKNPTVSRKETRVEVQQSEFTFTANELTVEEPVNVQAADTSYLSIDTMDLIEQLAENVRVAITEGTTSMEMQLNPENLGKVYLQISSKEGVVNASLTATNEAVRQVLESQIADLRQSLSQAGVKVDAIEVTVASHEFERNLEQNQNQEQQQGQRQQEQNSQRRNINLSSLDELSGVMTEEEALVAQIMRDNGNSVDLTA
jgi:flagellar hook-length control protein FliK